MAEREGDTRPPLSKRKAIDAISRYLPNEWSNLTDDQVTIQNITGGYMNTVNIVIRSTESVVEPNQVILHHSGGGFKQERGKGTSFATRFEELLVFHESSKIGVAPKLYGACEEYSVQEYVKGHTLGPDECLNPKILTKLAQSYAKFHTMDLPIDRVKFVENIPAFRKKHDLFLEKKDELNTLIIETFPHLNWDEVLAIDIGSEYEWIIKMIGQIRFRRVVVTGDTNYLNVLISEDENRIALVDYEMTKYDPRGMDLGSHFGNRTLKWNNKENKANGYSILERDVRYQFITEYCNELGRHADQIKDYDPTDLDSVDHVMEEADIGILTFALVWGGGLLCSLGKLIKVDNGSFCTAAHHLLSMYPKLKEEMLQKYPHWTYMT